MINRYQCANHQATTPNTTYYTVQKWSEFFCPWVCVGVTKMYLEINGLLRLLYTKKIVSDIRSSNTHSHEASSIVKIYADCYVTFVHAWYGNMMLYVLVKGCLYSPEIKRLHTKMMIVLLCSNDELNANIVYLSSHL